MTVPFPRDFDTSTSHIPDKKNLEHCFWNGILQLYTFYSSEDLYAQYKQQKKQITEKIPVTEDNLPVFFISYPAVNMPRFKKKMERNEVTVDHLIYKQHKGGIIKGATFERAQRRVTFSGNDAKARNKGKISPNQIHHVILKEEELAYRQKLGLLFDQDGEIVTYPQYREKWDDAIDQVKKYKTAREAMGAVVRVAGLEPRQDGQSLDQPSV